jgi:hypothetical protein
LSLGAATRGVNGDIAAESIDLFGLPSSNGKEKEKE